MGEIIIRLNVPDGMEEDMKRKIEKFLREELSKRRLNPEILRKYEGIGKGEIKEEEWYLQ